VAAVPKGLKVKHLDLNKRVACDLNKGVRAKSPPRNDVGMYVCVPSPDFIN